MKSSSAQNEMPETIVAGALKVAEDCGYQHLTRDKIAEAAGVSMGLVTYYFSMKEIREKIVKWAIQRKNVKVLAQAMLARDPAAKRAPDELQAQARAHIASLI